MRVVDPESAAVRAELPAWFDGWWRLSPDGRRVAALRDQGLEVWPTDAWPRWPVALLAAAAGGGVGWRWRGKR